MDGFKQRLIGAIVLVSLAVIFIPMIFEEPHQEKTTEVLQIPAQPEVPAFTIESPQPPARSQRSAEQTASLSANDALQDDSENKKRLMTIAEMKAAEQRAIGGGETASPIQVDKPTPNDSALVDDGNPANGAVADSEDSASEVPRQTEQIKYNRSEQNISTDSAQIAAVDPRASVSESAWVVQIGTFRNRPGAVKIRDELRSTGTPSYTMDIVSGEIPMVRVFAGPTETKEAALALKRKVDKRYKLQSMVVTYKGP